MSEQVRQKPKWIKSVFVTAYLLVGLVSVATFLLSLGQSDPAPVEVAQIDQEGYIIVPLETFEESDQSIELIDLKPEHSFETSTCFVSELDIPLVRHLHWPGSHQDIQPDLYGGAFMHDLFYRANCP